MKLDKQDALLAPLVPMPVWHNLTDIKQSLGSATLECFSGKKTVQFLDKGQPDSFKTVPYDWLVDQIYQQRPCCCVTSLRELEAYLEVAKQFTVIASSNKEGQSIGQCLSAIFTRCVPLACTSMGKEACILADAEIVIRPNSWFA